MPAATSGRVTLAGPSWGRSRRDSSGNSGAAPVLPWAPTGALHALLTLPVLGRLGRPSGGHGLTFWGIYGHLCSEFRGWGVPSPSLCPCAAGLVLLWDPCGCCPTRPFLLLPLRAGPGPLQGLLLKFSSTLSPARNQIFGPCAQALFSLPHSALPDVFGHFQVVINNNKSA